MLADGISPKTKLIKGFWSSNDCRSNDYPSSISTIPMVHFCAVDVFFHYLRLIFSLFFLCALFNNLLTDGPHFDHAKTHLVTWKERSASASSSPAAACTPRLTSHQAWGPRPWHARRILTRAKAVLPLIGWFLDRDSYTTTTNQLPRGTENQLLSC